MSETTICSMASVVAVAEPEATFAGYAGNERAYGRADHAGGQACFDDDDADDDAHPGR